MTYVALLEVVVIFATTIAWVSLLRSVIRQHARERDLMMNQVMHMADRTWQPPPSEVSEPIPEPEDDGRYVLTPESLPDY